MQGSYLLDPGRHLQGGGPDADRDPLAVKAWCPDIGETEPDAPNVTDEIRPHRAAEETAFRVYEDPRAGDVIEVHVRDDDGKLYIFHVEVDTSPRFDAFHIGPPDEETKAAEDRLAQLALVPTGGA